MAEQIECSICGKLMPLERKTMAGYDLCIECNDEKPAVGFMVYGHKTAGDVKIIKNNSSNKEQIRKAMRANRRSR